MDNNSSTSTGFTEQDIFFIISGIMVIFSFGLWGYVFYTGVPMESIMSQTINYFAKHIWSPTNEIALNIIIDIFIIIISAFVLFWIVATAFFLLIVLLAISIVLWIGSYTVLGAIIVGVLMAFGLYGIATAESSDDDDYVYREEIYDRDGNLKGYWEPK